MRALLQLLVFSAGFAALSWEILWQVRVTLALGLSAIGTAVVLATTMLGMTAGSLAMGRWLKTAQQNRPLLVYGLLELVIGIAGFSLGSVFRLMETLDTSLYQVLPDFWPIYQCLLVLLALGVPTIAMGATIPVLGLLAEQHDLSLSRLYGWNTAGASLGCLALAFFFIPRWGTETSANLIASINLTVFLTCLALNSGTKYRADNSESSEKSPVAMAVRPYHLVTVGLTGAVTFALEVAWFRALKGAFQSTSESFALMLSAVLVALAVGAHLAPLLRKRKNVIPALLVLAGCLILLVTPLIERADTLTQVKGKFLELMISRFLSSLLVLGTPVAVLGTILPIVLDRNSDTETWSKIYAVNTLGAVAGSVFTAWILLPSLGFAQTSWFVGLLVVLLGLYCLERRIFATIAAALALSLAIWGETGVGRLRVIGRINTPSYKVIECREGPDNTVAVLELPSKDRILVIDGFQAADDNFKATHYMRWMAHLPMVLHPNPKDALVICLGTGQTLNGLRVERATNIDLVELSPAVLAMNHHFKANNEVLKDPSVHPILMDGRAWMRRTKKNYDVITLEPMPPNFVGVNSLYSLEFYQLAGQRLNENGVIAQWLPLHLVPPEHGIMIAHTFQKAFPNSALWIDPVGFTAILVGRKNSVPLGQEWPGLKRKVPRTLTDHEVKRALFLDQKGLERYTHGNKTLVTDENQALAYGAYRLRQKYRSSLGTSIALIHHNSTLPPPQDPSMAALAHKIAVGIKSEGESKARNLRLNRQPDK